MTKSTLRLQNTETRRKEPLVPLQAGHVRMYTCGPTVYNFAHIGNFRTYVFEDLLRRTIKFFGMKITHVMNLTDVDDKTIRGAVQEGTTLDAFTQKYKDAFFEDCKVLNIERAEHYPAATDYIPQMIKMVELLITKGLAYVASDGSVYYSISKFPRYGCLSHLKLEDLQAGASERVSRDEYDKEHVSDFVLWKKYDPERDGKIFWESPFGQGRPGWHLECSAMATELLGETLDIHVGAVDNIFPHHENEIAQSEGCTGKRFAGMWLHSEHLIVDHKKMSKSLGNFYTLRDLLARNYTGAQIRYMLLQTHYRTQLNFSFKGLEAAKTSLRRLGDFTARMQGIAKEKSAGTVSDAVQAVLKSAFSRFEEAIADDLNISPALASLFDMLGVLHGLADKGMIASKDAQEVLAFLHKVDAVLGVLPFEPQVEVVPQKLQEALERRVQARKDKNWALSDELRDYIASDGYIIEDTPAGARLKKR